MSGKLLTSTINAKKFYKQTFALKYAGIGYTSLHTLLVNPEDMSVEEPSRSSVTQTIGGAYVKDFGAGLPTVTLAGTTGYKARVSPDGYLTDGYQEFKNLRDDIYRLYINSNDPKLTMYWFDWENDQYYQIQPDESGFKLLRNKAEPLLYRYEFKFTCLQRLSNRKYTETQLLVDPRSNQMWNGLGSSLSELGSFLTTLK
jgi:hypothetical protein